ncbi:hypothetical protein PUN28_001001 [Cardiocondyla obscurior]|uniref:Uncharacterized protein n=1 Tax=Cardiocondyla obscurior TaxID=286306 RepID=A0AAW2H2D3_9HYME
MRVIECTQHVSTCQCCLRLDSSRFYALALCREHSLGATIDPVLSRMLERLKKKLNNIITRILSARL